MTTRIRIETTDGMMLQGGHELTMQFSCDDSFLQRQIDTYGNEGLDYLVEETAKDISGHIFIDLDSEEEGEEDRDEGYDHLAPYRYDGEGDWTLTIHSVFGVTDTLADTCGGPIAKRLRPHFARLLAAEAISRGRFEIDLLAESVLPNDAERPDFMHVARDAVNHMPMTFDTVRGMYLAWNEIVNQNESNDVNAKTLTPRKLERELRDILQQQIEGLADHIEQEWNAIQRKRAVTRP